MAEGDTILRLARRIEAGLGGEPVTVRSPSPRARTARLDRLDGALLRGAEARGKHLLLDFGELVLHSHLAMSGGWHLYRRGQRWRRPERSAWVVLGGGDVDAVQFGGPTLRLLRPDQLGRDPTLNRLGPDILAGQFDLPSAAASLLATDPAVELGEALLDQRRLAGIGNIFKSEGCFAAGLDPWRAVSALDVAEAEALLARIRAQMLICVEGKPRPRQVYRRAGAPCRRCGSPVRSRGQGAANRTTYWCPRCQS